MNENKKLQEAVHLAMTAGYQIKREAFEFLTLLATTEDPSKLMTKAIEQLNSLNEKSLFIEKQMLEQVAEPKEPAKEIASQEPENVSSEISLAVGSQVTEGKAPFHPYAKEIDASINVIDNPCAKQTSSGTVEDFLEYFQDRFHRIERLLRQRIDMKSAASVLDALRAASNTRIKTICMITEKREVNQKTILTVEDLKGSATVLVPQNASQDLQRKAKLLIRDQVICLDVLKTRSSLLIAEDIILPEIAQRTQHRAPIPVYAVLTSDMHVGSAKFTKEAFSRFILWLNGKYGNVRMREIASHVKYILVAGDIVDGVGVYPNQIKELAVKDVQKQYRLAAKYLEQIPDYIEVVITPGNHDTSRKALPQPAIAGSFLETLQDSRKVLSLGSPCTIDINGVEILMFHGRSLDDIISNIPEMSYTHPEKAMRVLLQSRHLAPLYGGKTPLSPETKDSLVIERVPDIFHAGHVHSMEYNNYRGVLIVNSGCWQTQTDYMLRNGFSPTPAKIPVINLHTMEVQVIPFD